VLCSCICGSMVNRSSVRSGACLCCKVGARAYDGTVSWELLQYGRVAALCLGCLVAGWSLVWNNRKYNIYRCARPGCVIVAKAC
jgi:hypothetical protein